jgi:hypothetical protein
MGLRPVTVRVARGRHRPVSESSVSPSPALWFRVGCHADTYLGEFSIRKQGRWRGDWST